MEKKSVLPVFYISKIFIVQARPNTSHCSVVDIKTDILTRVIKVVNLVTEV